MAKHAQRHTLKTETHNKAGEVRLSLLLEGHWDEDSHDVDMHADRSIEIRAQSRV